MSKTYLIALGICLVIGGFIGYSIHPNDKSNEVIAKYQKRIEKVQDSLSQVIRVKQLEIDSLKSLEPRIIVKYKTIKESIDSTIAKDSTNSIPEYRKGLELLGTHSDNTKDLTYREIGFGAKYFTQLKEAIDLILLKDQISDKQQTLINQMQSKLDVALSETELLKLREPEEPSFWYKRFPVIIGVGIGYDIDRKTITPNIGLYWGIRIN